MPQGDDFIDNSPILPVDVTAPLAAPSGDTTPVLPDGDSAVSAPAQMSEMPSGESPEDRQTKSDRAFAAQRRAIAALQQEIAALKAASFRPPPPGPGTPASSDAPLRPEAFASHELYVQAVAAVEVQKAVEALQRRQATEAVQKTWQSQQAAFRQEHRDYDEVIEALDVPFHPTILDAVTTSDQGAALAYHLAIHPDEAALLAQLPPAAGLKALGKLEARLEMQSTPSSRQPRAPVTPAPAPLTPVRGTADSADTRPMETLPYEDFVERYKKQYHGR